MMFSSNQVCSIAAALWLILLFTTEQHGVQTQFVHGLSSSSSSKTTTPPPTTTTPIIRTTIQTPLADDDHLKPPLLSRRKALVTGAATITATTSILVPLYSSHHTDAAASIVGTPTSVAATVVEGPPERQNLLRAIMVDQHKTSTTTNESQVVERLIAQLEPLDPSKGMAAVVPELDGTWELIYSINAQAFSPLLNLPQPLRPTSLQLLGDDATREVGQGRVAQVLNFPFAPISILLSSGAVPVVVAAAAAEKPSSSSTLEIFPPFRLEVVWGDNNTLRKAGRLTRGVGNRKGGNRIQLVESGSDADFRALNARDEEAQRAGRNMYKQRYLEMTGQPGDLRISEVVSGDPAIVGCVFVHRRL